MTNPRNSSAAEKRICRTCVGHFLTTEDEKNQGQCQYCMLADSALVAFWETIARQFPQAKSGDLSPERTIGQHTAAVIAIEEWISNNVLPQEDEDQEEASETVHVSEAILPCKTCGSALIFMVNDPIFWDGECGLCERRSYRNHAEVLQALTTIRNATESLDYDDEDETSELNAKTAVLDQIRNLAYRILSKNAHFRGRTTSRAE